MPTTIALDSEWKQVKFGAGGYVTGIDMHSDGTMVARTDGAGAYRWDGDLGPVGLGLHDACRLYPCARRL